jgi:uncharacterized repeat protein (TIGR01451 family)
MGAVRLRLLVMPFLLLPCFAQSPLDTDPTASHAQLVARYGKLPMAFEANHGQTDPRVRFLARGSGYELFLTADEAVLALRAGSAIDLRQSGSEESAGIRATSVLRMKLAGANLMPTFSGVEELPGRSNYFLGNDPKKWSTNVPTYRKVRYGNVYPGVDLVYYGSQGQLEYDFVVAPGGDPARIALSFAGAQPNVDANGDLLLSMSGGDVRFRKPVMYQNVGGRKHWVDGHYAIVAGNSVRFEVGNFDHNRALVIDPVLAYSTYLGGTQNDVAWAIAVDSSGNAYVTGETYSLDFPVKNPIESYHTGGNCGDTGQCFDVFVTKLNSTGTALIYSTYLGGINDDIGYGIAVDSAGNAYVAGYTTSDDFPTTAGVLRSFCGELMVNGKPTGTCNIQHVPDAFVTKLNATGSAIDYSTFIGGTGFDSASAIAVDAAGEAYVVGQTNGVLPTGNPNDPGFPLTTTAFQSTYPGGGPYTTFFVKLNATGSAELYGSLLGSPTAQAHSYATGVAIDSAGDGYMIGYTGDKNFPTTPGAFQTTCKPGTTVCNGYFGIVAKFDPTKDAAASLVYSTYLGGTSSAAQDKPFGIAVDSAGDAYVTGASQSSDFPTTKGAFQTLCMPVGTTCATTFVTKLNATGTGLVYSTFLGNQPIKNFATNVTQGFAIHLDSSKHAYVTGSVVDNPAHLSFPELHPVKTYVNGNDAFVTEFNPTGTALMFSTWLGGTGNDYGQGISVSPSGSIYVAGQTSSDNFPTTTGAFQTHFNGPSGGTGTDAFVARIAPIGADMAVTNSAPASVTSGSNLTYTIVATNSGPDTASSVRVTDKTPTGTTFVSTSTSVGSCTAPAVGGTGTVLCKVTSLAKAAKVTVTLVVKVTGSSGSTINDTVTVSSAAFDPNAANNAAKRATKVQ